MQHRSDCRILIVEDDLNSSEALAEFLRRHGHEVEVAATLTSAVVMLSAELTHLILDLRLPDGTGLRMLERARELNLPVKVAIVTGLDQGDMVADAVLLHPDLFLKKPLDFTDILAWVNGHRPCLNDYLAGGQTSASWTF